MKKCVPAMLILFLLAGCSNVRAVPPTQTSVPGTNPANSVQTVTVSDIQPGPGHKTGVFAASFGNVLYYFDQGFSDAGDYTGSCIYRKDTQTGKTEVLRQTANDNYIHQLFTDETGNLYYCLSVIDKDGDPSNYLYAYNENSDVRLAEHVDSVVRVDRDYIYFHREDIEGNANEEEVLFAYRMKDKAIVRIANQGSIAAWEDQFPLVQWEQAGGMVRFTVYNPLTKASKSVDIPQSAIQINPVNSDMTGGYFASADGNTLVLFVGDAEAEKTTLYRIDMAQGKLLSSKKVNGSIEDCTLTYNNKLYFYAYQCPDEKMINQAVYSLDADGSLKKLMGIKDSEECEKIYKVEVEAGLLFVYSVQNDDTTVYDYITAIPIS